MATKVKILLFGPDHECRRVGGVLKEKLPVSRCCQEHHCMDDLEQLEKKLVDWEPTLLFVLADGAEGMECVYRAKERKPALPVFWFSDDRNFGIQSYRLDCAYFAPKPITEETVESALRRCDHLGICYGR